MTEVQRRRQVVISHPGRQHVHETVLAAQRTGQLQAFATGIHFSGSAVRRLTKIASKIRPHGSATRGALQHQHGSIDPRRVRTFSSRMLLARAMRHSPLGSSASQWAHSQTDRAIARWLEELQPPPGLVHGFDGSCGATLKAAQQRGATKILEATNAHEYALAALSDVYSDLSHLERATDRVRSERQLADFVLAPSQFVEQCLRSNGVDRDRIVYLPYGANVRPYADEAREQPDGVFRALFVGRVGERKGVRHLIEAWANLMLPRSELILVGDTDRSGRAMLAQYRDSLTWIGQARSAVVREWFERADVFVLPSLAEGSALVTYEAMACGLPVITTPNAGSVVRNEVDGVIVTPADVEALMGAFLLLYEDQDLRHRMGASGRERIETAFTWRHYRARVAKLYADLLDGHPSPCYLHYPHAA